MKAKKTEQQPQSDLAKLRRVLFFFRLEQKAGRLLKTHQIEKIKREIARQLTKNRQNEKFSTETTAES